MADETRIDPRAVVDPEARLGSRVVVGPNAVIGAEVEVGDGCQIGASAVIEGPTELGPDNVVSPMASVGGPPQDLKFAGERTVLRVGARNKIREFVTLNRGTSGGGGETVIGDDNLFMAYAHVGHDSRVGSRTIFANGATLAGHVVVGDDSTVGAYAAVHQFCRVANQAFIGGFTVVTQDALPWVMTVGSRPAKAYGLNTVGLKRKGYPPETIRALKRTFHLLFRSKMIQKEAFARVEKELFDFEEVRYFVEFVRSSERGVIR